MNTGNVKSNSICILGAALDTGNMGVSALCVSLINIFHSIDSTCKITLLVPGRTSFETYILLGSEKKRVSIINYRLSPFSVPWQHLLFLLIIAALYRTFNSIRFRAFIKQRFLIIRMIEDCSFIGDIFGGDGFSDIYGLKRLIKYSLPRLLIILLGRKITFLPQTYGPFKSRAARNLASFLLKYSDHIMSRDTDSIEIVKNLRPTNSDVQFCPDVAFTLPPRKPEIWDESILSAKTEGRRIIGINISGLLYMGGYTKRNMFNLRFNYAEIMLDIINQLTNDESLHVMLIPHTFTHGKYEVDDSIMDENDYTACAINLGKISPNKHARISLVPPEYDQSELKWIIGNCDFFIGSRMHSCIAALSQGIPTIGLSYSKKFIGVFSSIGLSKMVVDATKLSYKEALGFILDHVAKADSQKQALLATIVKVKEGIMQSMRLVVQGKN